MFRRVQVRGAVNRLHTLSSIFKLASFGRSLGSNWNLYESSRQSPVARGDSALSSEVMVESNIHQLKGASWATR